MITNDPNQTTPVVTEGAPEVSLPVVAAPSKPVWESATFWLNGLTLVALSLEGLTQGHLLDPFFKDPNHLAQFNGYAIATLAIVNLLLRVFKTVQPVTLKR